MILHGVYLRLAKDHDRAELDAVMQGLKTLCKALPGCAGFQHGHNLDLEQKSPDHPYGFIAQFRDVASLENYAENPEHKALGARLVGLCDGGADGIMVYDLQAGS